MQRVQSLKSALFWDLTQCMVVIPCRLFKTIYRSHLQRSRDFLTFEDGTESITGQISKWEHELHPGTITRGGYRKG